MSLRIFHHRDVQFLLLLFLSCAFIYGTLTVVHKWGGDFAAYIMQARSILEGTIPEFIEQNGFTIKEGTLAVGPVAYPWGFPVLLVPFYSVFGLDIVWLKLPVVLCFVLFLATLYYGFSRYHAGGWIIALTAFFAFNPQLLYFLNNILSDIPFLFFSTLSVLLIGRVAVQRRRIFTPWLDRWVLGALIAVTFFIRSNGILLLPVLAATQLLPVAAACYSRWRTGSMQASSGSAEQAGRSGQVISLVMNLVPYASFLLSVMLWRVWFPAGGSSHLESLDLITPASILYNILYYAALPREFFGSYLIYGASIPFVALGIRERYKTDYYILLYVALTIALYIIWPGRQGLRFLYPVLPFYVSFMLSGIQVWSRSSTFSGKRIDTRYVTAALAALILFYAVTSLHGVYRNLAGGRQGGDGPYTAEASEMFRFIREQTTGDDIIVFYKPRVMRLMTDRVSVNWFTPKDIVRGSYVVINKNSWQKTDYLAALEHVRHGETVFDNRRFLVIHI